MQEIKRLHKLYIMLRSELDKPVGAKNIQINQSNSKMVPVYIHMNKRLADRR